MEIGPVQDYMLGLPASCMGQANRPAQPRKSRMFLRKLAFLCVHGKGSMLTKSFLVCVFPPGELQRVTSKGIGLYTTVKGAVFFTPVGTGVCVCVCISAFRSSAQVSVL